MIRGKVSAITAFFNSIAESSNLPKATTIHDIRNILPAVFKLINAEQWIQLATTDNMFENVVAFLTAYAGNEDFTRALDANKASEGDDEEAMKIYVAALYEMRLQQQDALVSIVHTLSDADQMELTNIVSYLDHKEGWSSSRAWAGVLYEACQLESSPLSISDSLKASVVTPGASHNGKRKTETRAVYEQSVYVTPRSTNPRMHSARATGRGASAGDSPLLQHLNSPRAVDQTQLKQLQIQVARLKAEMTDLRRSVHNHENTEADLRAELNALNNQKLTLDDRYRRARDEAANASSLRRQVTDLEDERKDLTERVHRLETYYASCKAALQQSDQLLKDAHLEAERVTDAYEAEKLTVVDLRGKIEGMTDELAQANELNKDLRETIRRLREDDTAAKARFDETEASWRMKVDNLKTALAAKEAEYVQLIDTNNVVVERYVDDNNTLSAELDNKRLEVAMLTEELEATKKKLHDELEAMDRCEQREKEASAKYSNAQQELQKMREEVLQVKRHVVGLENELAELRRRQADDTELQQQLRTREMECNKLLDQNSTLSRMKAQLQRKITELTEELDRLRSIVQQMQAQQRGPSFSDRTSSSRDMWYTANDSTLRPFATSTPLRTGCRQPPPLELSMIQRAKDAAKPPSGRADDFSTPVRVSRSRSVTEQDDAMSTTTHVSRVNSSSRSNVEDGFANLPPSSATNRTRGVSSPPASDSARAAELRERNRKLPPHMRSHYAVEPLPPQFDLHVRDNGGSGRRDEGFQRASTIRLFKNKSASPSSRHSPAKTSKAEPNP